MKASRTFWHPNNGDPIRVGLIVASLATLLLWFYVPPAIAITNTWDGGGANNNWTTAANWNGNIAPVNGNTLLFPTNVADQITTNDFTGGSGLLVEGLLFQEDYTLRGNLVNLSNRIVATAQGTIILFPIFPTIDLDLRLVTAPVISVTANTLANLTFNGDISLGGRTILFTGVGQHIVNGVISGAGSASDVQKQGTGTLRLENTNTFAGDLLAQGGNTRVNGFVSNAIVSGASTFLSGTGRVGALTVNTTGNLQPGINAPGIFTVDGNMTLGSSGSLRIDLDGTALGTSYDQLRVGGPTVNLNSTGLVLEMAAGFFPAPGTVFTIISNTSVSAIAGTFAGMPEGAVTNVNGVKFQVSYVGGNGNDVTLTVQAPGTRTWDGGGATALWSNATNWSGDTLPESGDNLVFPAATPNRTNTMDLSVYRFGSLTLNGFPYVISNGTIPLTAGLVANHTSGTNIIASPIVLRASQTFSNSITTRMLVLNQIVNTNFDLRFDGAGDFQVGTLGPGSGSVAKFGAGRLLLIGSNQFAGNTFLGGGEMVLRSNATLANSSFLLVSNATIRGNGTLPGVALRNNTARIEPGESPGLLTVNGNLLLTNGTAEFEWTGPVAGTQYDQIVVNGTVSISNCNLATVAGYVPTTGQQLVLISNDGADAVVGQFNGLPEGTEFFASAVQAYVISYAGGDGNDVVLTKQVLHFVWDGGGAGNNWMTAGNWSADGVPIPGSSLGFPNSFPGGKSSASNDFPAYTAFRYIVLSNEFNLGGEAIELSEGLRMAPGVNHLNISNDVRLIQSQDWRLNTCTLRGMVDLNGYDLTFSFNAANQTVAFAGNLVGNGKLTGSLASMTLQYNGSNTLSGVTEIRLGNLSIGGIHSTGALRVLDNAKLTIETTGRVQNCSILLSNCPSSLDGMHVLGALTGAFVTNLNGYMFIANTGGSTNATVVQSNGTLSVSGVMIGSPFTMLGGTLEGQGYLSSVTATGGEIAPGGGQMRILRTGNLTLGPGVVVEMGINGLVAGTTHDQLSVTGSVNLASATLAGFSSELLSVSDSYTIINNDGADAIIGTFAGLPEGANVTVGLAQCQITYQGGDGNDVVLTVLSVGQRGVWAGLSSNDPNWTVATNWAGAVLPEVGDPLLFPPGAGQLTNVFNESVDRTYHSLTFGGSNYQVVSSFSFNPQKLLTFTNGIYATNATGTNVMISRLGFLNSSVVSNTPGNTLVLSGLISNNFNVVLPIFSPAGEMQVGPIGASSTSLIKRGPGRLRLVGCDAIGTHQVQEGTLAGASSEDFGSRFVGTFIYANLVVSNGATLEVLSGPFAISNPVQLHGRMLVNATNAAWVEAINLLGANSVIEVGAGAQLTVNGALTGNNGFTMDGVGILRFSNVKTYTGGTFVNGGQLFSEGLSTNASVTVNSGGVFSGVGPVGPLTCFNGAIAPGRLTTAGFLYCDQGVNMNSFTQYRIRLFDSSSGTNYDQLRVVGPVVLNNAQLVVTQMLAFIPPVGSSFQIITNDSFDAVIGTFAGVPQNGFFTNGSTVFQVSYIAGTGNDVVLTTHHYLTTGTTRTWSGLGADGFWTTPQNWVGNVAPTPGDLLSFSSGAARLTNTNNHSTNTFFQKIEVADAYELVGNPLALRDGIAASATALIALPVVITGGSPSSGLELSADNALVTLTQQGPIDCNTFPVRALGAGQLLFTGPIRGPGGFTQLGTNSEFRGANTYSGPTIVSAGKLTCRDSAPGANNGSALIVTNSGVLDLLQTGTLNKNFILGGQITVSNAGTVTWNGALQFVSNRVTMLNVAANTTLRLQLALDQNQPGQVVKDGPGTLHLEDQLIPGCCYFPALVRGGVTVNQGRLVLDSDFLGINPLGYSNVVVNGGSDFLAVGEIQGVTVNNGSLRPNLGAGTGRALLFGNLNLAPSAAAHFQINGVTPGNEHDQIGVRGAVNLGGATLNVALGITPVLGTSFLIVTNDGAGAVTGAFAGLPQDAIFPAGPVFLQISYNGGDGNDVSLTRVNPPFQIGSITPQPDGSMEISGTGQPGLPHVLEGTTNLAPTIIWLPLRTNNADPLGLLNFVDTSATNFPTRFYRVRGP